MAEIGKVTEVKDDLVVVRLERKEACAHCRACVAGADAMDMIIEAENKCEAKEGDWVHITLDQSSFLSAVLIIYIIPLAGLLVGVTIGYLLSNQNEAVALVTGVICTALCYLGIKMNESKFKNEKKYRPVAEEITEAPIYEEEHHPHQIHQ